MAHSSPANPLPPNEPAPQRLAEEPRTCVMVEFGEQAFAIDVAAVREILDIRPITPLPNAPTDLLGMIDLRGESIAVIDLTARLALPGRGTRAERIIVLDLDGGSAVGVVADRVLSVIEVTTDSVEPCPDTRIGWACGGLQGVVRIAGRQTLLLDPALVLGSGAGDAFDFT